jgi:hypothetical protein
MPTLEQFETNCVSIEKLQKIYSFTVMVETGCYIGESLEHASSYDFILEIYSCDINEDFVDACKKKFQSKSHIKIFNEDSHSFLHRLLPSLDHHDSIFFWLDAHYWKSYIPEYNNIDYPLVKELNIIDQYRKDKNDVIVIDDVYTYIKKSENFKHTHNIPKTGTEFLKKFNYSITNFDSDSGYLLLTR